MIRLTHSLLCFFLFSCTVTNQQTMRQEDCRGLDWQRRGEIEGAKGLSLEMLDYHIQRCPPEIESVARSKYIKGHETGVPRYCNYRTGFIKGQAGDPLPNLCSSQQFSEFHKGYKEGIKASLK
ncbi:MAG: hypothetical protein CME63_10330 [Halobacteriovoraceae bacterium]|nr:hypothetical protein [Halobacteriovoraceae bacterium]